MIWIFQPLNFSSNYRIFAYITYKFYTLVNADCDYYRLLLKGGGGGGHSRFLQINEKQYLYKHFTIDFHIVKLKVTLKI